MGLKKGILSTLLMTSILISFPMILAANCTDLGSCTEGGACTISSDCEMYGRHSFTSFTISNSSTLTIPPYDSTGYDSTAGIANESQGWTLKG